MDPILILVIVAVALLVLGGLVVSYSRRRGATKAPPRRSLESTTRPASGTTRPNRGTRRDARFRSSTFLTRSTSHPTRMTCWLPIPRSTYWSDPSRPSAD